MAAEKGVAVTFLPPVSQRKVSIISKGTKPVLKHGSKPAIGVNRVRNDMPFDIHKQNVKPIFAYFFIQTKQGRQKNEHGRLNIIRYFIVCPAVVRILM